jgi:predicted CopG family antitoxin
MTISKEEIPKFTNFSNKTITANENFRPFVLEQLELVKSERDSFVSFIEEQVIFGEKKKNLLVERDNSLVKSNKLIKKIYNRLDEDFPTKISFLWVKRDHHILQKALTRL